ncbi:MAG: tRNA 2-thiouridine(34) synthase MnmA [Ignavibacteria bacterium]|nr:tRNA 2-thiouridine(34) synthase MnmA [Ignavibacteria bacterium]MBT8381039.1 tRNA 2-thiouridine(34) synthase MnmA [Ignavibacteria bacterium]MBT8393042.1 tRNA 2-thiouridine(34) synthase MnmA [Ignavibacteria bacterium]NNJ52011.1 tRNA 2-thiouridine(34) synthase MnmA [Ignavibacteriaceae bacterium]NNL19726.1 tRNA 2-thiouridine(34) synthase MnmA [Ignavibacteriaceae bacterium]
MKIAVLLSGGVDSSVALKLLKNEGHELTAFYLKIWLQDEFSFLGECPWEEDLKFCRDVCRQTDVPLEIIPLQTEYWDNVVSYTIEEIQEGRTPNPDIFCNSLIKFGEFYDKIDFSFEKVASGHYANVQLIDDRYALKTSPDPVKDQTYFLAYLTQQQLSRALFPIGKFKKSEIRKIAEDFNLPTQIRRDSQGICFLGQIKFKEFIKHHLGEIEGDIIDTDSNKVMGRHPGYYYYTIGQRSGLKLGGGPWFVVKKDVESNIVYISKENRTVRERSEFRVGKLNWILDEIPNKKNLNVKIRHGVNKYKCKIDWENSSNINVILAKPDKGIAAGQFAVFYDNDVCLGGGVILE